MGSLPDTRDIKVAIVGGGVFGISTALHLAKKGYKHVTVFDRDELESTGYSVAGGCSGASADENKVIRASYGNQKLYQDLAFGALDEWEAWNEEIRTSATHPPDMTADDRVWYNCGFLRAGEDGIPAHEEETQASLPKHAIEKQYRISDDAAKQTAAKNKVALDKLDPFRRTSRGLPLDGFLDMTGGFVRASKSCTWALHRCRQLGVQFRFGAEGTIAKLLYQGQDVVGLETVTGAQFHSDVVVVACGGWTPALLPEVSSTLQTTAGSVVTVAIPENRTDLLEMYSPDRFPAWSWKLNNSKLVGTEVGSIYGFPRNDQGLVKVGFRGTKFTHFTDHFDARGEAISYPMIAKNGIPVTAMNTIRDFFRTNMPSLAELPIASTRLCWYTDSIDNSFLIDRVPGSKGLIVASGGSGHGFKFLPVIGAHVVDVIENRETAFSTLFRWRTGPESHVQDTESRPDGSKTLAKQQLVTGWA